MQLARIRLSDKVSSLRTRQAALTACLRCGIQRSLHRSSRSGVGRLHTDVNLPGSCCFCVDLELRSLRSSIVTRFFATMNLSDSPTGLFQTSRFFSWGLAPHQFGPPVLTASILCSHPLTNTPAALGAAPVARFTPRLRPSSCFNRLGVHIALFEACSVFILIRGCVLADPAALDLLHRKLRAGLLPVRHAPTASGWSNSCRVGYLPPLDLRALSTAH